MASGTKSVACLDCDIDSRKSTLPLVECLGYSAPQDGDGGIMIGYKINSDAVSEYETVNKTKIKYGLFAVVYENLDGKDILNSEDGSAQQGVLKADVTNTSFALMKLKVVGFDTEESKSVKLCLGAYAIEGEGENIKIHYLQPGTPSNGEKYCCITYNEIV